MVGGNGSGKTTLCLTICGFATKFEKGTLKGEVLIKGKDIDEYQEGEVSRMIGYVPVSYTHLEKERTEEISVPILKIPKFDTIK